MKTLKFIFSLLSLFLLVNLIAVSKPEYQNQTQADAMVQQAIYYLWNDGDVKKAKKDFFRGITIRGNLKLVEYFFKQAADLEPGRLNHKFCMASAQILQGKVNEALSTYEAILKLDPDNFNASILSAVYLKVKENPTKYQETIDKLTKEYPSKTQQYIKTIENIENNLKLNLLTNSDDLSASEDTAIVILGGALKADGSMQAALIKRLGKGLEAAGKFKNATIIVSGGVPRQGICESYLMKKWLLKKGIDSNRIIIEDKSKDTVGNALFCLEILKKLKVKNAVIVTSASHIRRALTIFEEGGKIENMNIKFSNLVYMDYNKLEEAYIVTRNEKLSIFRDVFRMSGIWACPGIQR